MPILTKQAIDSNIEPLLTLAYWHVGFGSWWIFSSFFHAQNLQCEFYTTHVTDYQSTCPFYTCNNSTSFLLLLSVNKQHSPLCTCCLNSFITKVHLSISSLTLCWRSLINDIIQPFQCYQCCDHLHLVTTVCLSTKSHITDTRVLLWINDSCFRPRFCTVRLYWAGDNLASWDEICYESCPGAG